MDLPRVEGDLRGHSSWRAIVGFYLKGIAAAVALGAIAYFADGTGLALLVCAVVAGITVLPGS